jgi:Protein of unknown function (DUF2889)
VTLARDIHRDLRGTSSCTHLNDMLRFVADTLVMAQALEPAH